MSKYVQIVDGALNSTLSIYEISEDQFSILFPDGRDIAFLSDLVWLENNAEFWNNVYSVKVDKKNITGIHGTLHLTGSYVDPLYFPNRKESDVR